MQFFKVKCDQCNACSINGMACHEHGCPKAKWPWHYDEDAGTCEPISPYENNADYYESFEDTGRDNWRIDGMGY